MNYLFDTHSFMWFDNHRTQLSNRVLGICNDPSNFLYFSLASAWEIQIKIMLGKMTLPLPLEQMIYNQQANEVDILPIRLSHILELGTLPNHHRDPFDRLLIAQAKVEGYTLLSRDPLIAQYPITVIW